MNRRKFLACVAGAARVYGQNTTAPVLDFHQHLYAGHTVADRLTHSAVLGATKTVLLPGTKPEATQAALDASRAYPDRLIAFANPNPLGNAARVLHRYSLDGCKGVGEQKFAVDVDSAEMRRIYEAAGELGMPVLLHFEEGHFNSGFARFENVLKRHPDTTFVGHANTFWANISANPEPQSGYPKGPVVRGGLTGHWLADYANLYADLSANSGLNALTRDPDFAGSFIGRHAKKLIWGTDCPCLDGKGAGTPNNKCIGRECLRTLLDLTSGDQAILRPILWENGAGLLKLV
jgi:uncharacterized protein